MIFQFLHWGEDDLHRLIMNPRDIRSCVTVAKCLLASSLDFAIISVLSRFRVPSFLSVDTTGFISFVNMNGALLSPNGSLEVATLKSLH